MAPATRRSSGFGSHANSPSNLDHILEHFNQFKRKHITQNRDIIKTNALAQLRIKELEEKVLQLEAEKTQIGLESFRMKSRLEKAEKAILCIRQGWQFIGAGMASISSIEGFDTLLEQQQQQQHRQSPSTTLQALQQQDNAHLRPSSRIVLDPNALPGGVARNVSRPPEADLADVIEEEDDHPLQQNGMFTEAGMHNPSEEDTREEMNEEDVDSDNGEGGDQISFGNDGEDTVRIQEEIAEATYLSQQDSTIRIEDEAMHTLSIPSAQNTPSLQISLIDSSNSQPGGRSIQRMTSIDSLSSFADDEEIELSTDDEQHVILNRAPTPASGSRMNRLDPQQYVAVRTKTPRKRKNIGTPEDVRRSNPHPSSLSNTRDQGHQKDSVETDNEEEDNDDDDENNASPSAVRSSRRSSMRDRKSVNYALPKLNTKMRKPDPVDLVPAVRSERRKRSGSSTRTSPIGGNGEHDGGSTIQDTDGDDSGLDEGPRRRALKGKHEVASTGNLREIRKQHEIRSEQNGMLSRVLNNGTGEANHYFHEEQENGRKENDVRMEEIQPQQSPRRRSSRQSLRRRSSSSLSSEVNQVQEVIENTINPESKEESENLTKDKIMKNEDEYTLPGHQPIQSISKLPMSNESMPSSTPKYRSTSGKFSEGEGQGAAVKPRVVSADSSSTGTGTPIPKPTIRAGQSGNIKALNKAAGRIQKTPSSMSGLPMNGGGSMPQQQRMKTALSNGKMASSSMNTTGNGSVSAVGSQARVLKVSSKMNTPSTSRSVSSSSTASSSGGAGSGETKSLYPNGDPTKRNSLHAAMTWQEISTFHQNKRDE